MKKLMTFLLSAVMSLSLAFSAPAADAGEVLGEWHGSLLGVTLTLILYGDSSYSMSMDGYAEQISKGTWEWNNNKVVLTSSEGADEGTLEYRDTEKLLTITEGDMEISFSRNQVYTFSPTDPKTDARPEDYQGLWSSNFVTVMGLTVDGREAGFDLAAEVKKDSVILRSTYLVMQGEEMPFSYENGVLHVTLGSLIKAISAGTQSASQDGADGVAITMQLLQDNTMAVNLSVSGMDMIFYMNRLATP